MDKYDPRKEFWRGAIPMKIDGSRFGEHYFPASMNIKVLVSTN
jgi:hypothetical protein